MIGTLLTLGSWVMNLLDQQKQEEAQKKALSVEKGYERKRAALAALREKQELAERQRAQLTSAIGAPVTQLSQPKADPGALERPTANASEYYDNRYGRYASLLGTTASLLGNVDKPKTVFAADDENGLPAGAISRVPQTDINTGGAADTYQLSNRYDPNKRYLTQNG